MHAVFVESVQRYPTKHSVQTLAAVQVLQNAIDIASAVVPSLYVFEDAHLLHLFGPVVAYSSVPQAATQIVSLEEI